MPRKKRVWYPGAVYHIMSRGNHRSDIFYEEEDYERYLKIVEFVKVRCPFELYGYCLMTNHVHLQIKTSTVAIWHIMKRINMYYTLYFNDKHNVIGHLFQGRYTAELIENDAYTLQTSRYIHLNPVKAKMVTCPIEYPWSSYEVFMGIRTSDLVDENQILQYFANNSRLLYQHFVENATENDAVNQVSESKMEVV